MIRLALLADLHFGEGTPEAAEALREDVLAHDPSALLVAGDLTRRARAREFAAARDFLSRFDRPTLVVPGNHDIPRGDLWRRFTNPRAAWIEAGLPLADGDLVVGQWAVLALDTVRRAHTHLDWSAGGVSRAQMAALPERLAALGNRRALLLCHHPLRHPPGLAHRQRPRRADMALGVLGRLGVEGVLSGHLHVSTRLPGTPDQIIAPTALSPRVKGTPNGWTLLELHDTVDATTREWSGTAWSARRL